MAKSAEGALHPARAKLSTLGIGASEIGAVCGLSPWITSLDVWRRRFEPEAILEGETYSTRRGRLLEPVLLKLLEHEAGITIRNNREPFVHQDPICFATPDGIVHGSGYPVEVKSTTQEYADEWLRSDGSVRVPPICVVQCAWQMRATDKSHAYIAADLGSGMPFNRLSRNGHLENALVYIARMFWDRYVTPRVAPTNGAPELNTIFREAWECFA